MQPSIFSFLHWFTKRNDLMFQDYLISSSFSWPWYAISNSRTYKTHTICVYTSGSFIEAHLQALSEWEGQKASTGRCKGCPVPPLHLWAAHVLQVLRTSWASRGHSGCWPTHTALGSSSQPLPHWMACCSSFNHAPAHSSTLFLPQSALGVPSWISRLSLTVGKDGPSGAAISSFVKWGKSKLSSFSPQTQSARLTGPWLTKVILASWRKVFRNYSILRSPDLSFQGPLRALAQ